MKELQQKQDTIQEIVYQQKKQQEVELLYLYSIRPHRGHKVFEICVETLVVREAEYVQERMIEFGTKLEVLPPRKLVVKPNHVYIAALNSKRALDRYKKGKGSAGIKETDFKLPLQ
jgi:hypothetical protein